jgi:hypothetical protein
VKGYRLIDISLDWLIIERSVQFEESVSHVPQQPHTDTFTLPPVRDDENAHVDSSLDESFDSEDSNDSYLESVQSDAKSEHQDVVAEPEQRPKWAQTTLQAAGISLVIQPILGGIDLISRSLLLHSLPLTATELFPSRHLFLVQYSDP